MTNDFDQILDLCIDRLSHGESLEACLNDYPEHAKQLEPLLRTMGLAKSVYSFTPSVDVKRVARQRFYVALEKHNGTTFVEKIRARPLVWAALASVLVILLISFVTLRATVFPVEPPSITLPGPSADGNFVFLVSDEVNAIGDFTSMNVTIDKVGLLKSGDDQHWVEFVPEVKEFDLTLLPREKTQELWRGNVPEGEYTKVVIYVTGVEGILKSTGETVTVKLPSNKLQMSKAFSVSADNVTSFTYDLTVVKASNAQGGSKYLLKPQIGESGASQQPDQSKGKEKPNKQP